MNDGGTAGASRIMVVGQDPLFRDSAASALAIEGWMVVASESEGLNALSMLAREPIDLVLVIGDPNRVSAAPFRIEVKRRWPATVVVCIPDSDVPVEAGLGYGASHEEVIREMRHPELARTRSINGADPGVLRIASLTPRERTVLQRLGQGMRPADIAEDLDLSRHTIRSHMANLHRKLNVHKRVELIRLAAETGLLSREDLSRGR
jgi:DNA-binding NarL/FixJ family response regulator